MSTLDAFVVSILVIAALALGGAIAMVIDRSRS